MINLDKFFANKLDGHISAELVLDADSKPISIKTDKLDNYKIKFNVVTSNPEVKRVVYHLDPSYYDPVREARDKKNDFEIETTTYGDYSILVDVQVGSENVRQQIKVSDLLKETYKESLTEAIAKAIKAIEEH